MARGALLPLFTALGTTAAVAVLAQKYIPQYMETKHKTTKKPQRDELLPSPTATQPAMQSTTSPNTPKKEATVATEPVASARSSLLVALLLQDSFLLLSAFGVCVMVVAVLVSLALVSLREDVDSLNDLQMFPPLMLIAMVMISLGMVGSMLRPKASSDVLNQPAPAPVPVDAIKKTAQENEPTTPTDASQEGFLYTYYRNKYANQTEETGELDEDGKPKKRVSRCPFGFT